MHKYNQRDNTVSFTSHAYATNFNLPAHVPYMFSHAFTHLIYRADDSDRNATEITLDSTLLTELSFQRCLEFLYTGYVDVKSDSEGLEDTLKAAQLFNLPELQLIVENAQIGDEHLSPGIALISCCWLFMAHS